MILYEVLYILLYFYTFILLYFYTLYFAKALFVFVKTHISINVIMCVFMCSLYSMQFKGLINSRDLNVFFFANLNIKQRLLYD